MSTQTKYTTDARKKRVRLRKLEHRKRAEEVRKGLRKPSKKHKGNGAFGPRGL